ncbi:MAG: hypothetical protein Q8M07_26870 [Prosthecobacter sp.]|nr:hypothetical protein [Prosthecobacter sp.]
MNKMPQVMLAILSVFHFGASHLMAQADSKAVMIRGKFYVDVDDTCKIYLNGVSIHHAQDFYTITPQVALADGDRLVIHVWDKGEPKGLKLFFVSTDRKWMINFPANSYRYWHDPEIMDFTVSEFQKLKDGPKKTGGKKDRITFKNDSDFVWGDKPTGSSWLAVLINKNMVVPFKQ